MKYKNYVLEQKIYSFDADFFIYDDFSKYIITKFVESLCVKLSISQSWKIYYSTDITFIIVYSDKMGHVFKTLMNYGKNIQHVQT